LFTLSQVCHKSRGYLCAPKSFSTQQIWKESRLQFMPEPNERKKYVELLMTERGCQIYKHSKKCKIIGNLKLDVVKNVFSRKLYSKFCII
jgi:hypothetical protein